MLEFGIGYKQGVRQASRTSDTYVGRPNSDGSYTVTHNPGTYNPGSNPTSTGSFFYTGPSVGYLFKSFNFSGDPIVNSNLAKTNFGWNVCMVFWFLIVFQYLKNYFWVIETTNKPMIKYFKLLNPEITDNEDFTVVSTIGLTKFMSITVFAGMAGFGLIFLSQNILVAAFTCFFSAMANLVAYRLSFTKKYMIGIFIMSIANLITYDIIGVFYGRISGANLYILLWLMSIIFIIKKPKTYIPMFILGMLSFFGLEFYFFNYGEIDTPTVFNKLYYVLVLYSLFYLMLLTQYFKNINLLYREAIEMKNLQLLKYFTAIEQCNATIMITDIHGKIEYANPQFEKTTGYSQEEIFGKNSRILSSGKTPSEIYVDLWNTINNGNVWKGEFVNLKKDRTEFIEKVVISPVKDKNGVIVNFIGVKDDITSKKKDELKLIESERKLSELNATKDKFFSIIAHDLKNPFNSILGLSGLLKNNINKFDMEKINKFVESINSVSLNAYKLLENLLEWSKAQTGKIDYKPTNLIFEGLLIDVVSLTENLAGAKNISINYKISDCLTVFADPNMLNTVLRNLISNAVKFTNRNGNITITAGRQNDEILVIVSDTGVGINENTIHKLFNISEKVSSLGTEEEKGTGLGLLLCKEFVEKHNGRIWVESIENKGSDFKFTIPLWKELS